MTTNSVDTNNIKVYEPIRKIIMKDSELFIPESAMAGFKVGLSDKSFFIELGGELYNKSEFKRTEKIIPKNSIEEYIMLLPGDTRKKILQREKEKIERVGRGFDSVEEIQNYIKDKGLAIK